MITKPMALVLAAGLTACSTMNVTLEEGECGCPTVSAIAKAPSIVPVKELIKETNEAMDEACGTVKAEKNNREEFVGGAAKVAGKLKELLKELRGWFPENTYTAAKKCIMQRSKRPGKVVR